MNELLTQSQLAILYGCSNKYEWMNKYETKISEVTLSIILGSDIAVVSAGLSGNEHHWNEILPIYLMCR